MSNIAFNWVRRVAIPALTIFVALMLPSLPASAGQTDSYTLPQQAYSQSRARDYKVYVPDNIQSPAPMVMALHGCKQTNNDVLNDWGLKAAADQYGFILVAPYITSYDGLRNQNCWGFWFEHHRHQGAGEVEDLHQIALAVENNTNYDVDVQRRYITGLSSGGAMAVVTAVAHNEYWAAAAPAAGIPYGEDAASVSLSGQCPGSATFHSVSRVVSDIGSEVDDAYPIPLMVLHNENDCTVIKTSADRIRDSHLKAFGDSAFDTPAETEAQSAACSPSYQNNYGCTRTRYTQDGTSGARSLVETVYFDGPLSTPNSQDTNTGHYWAGGEQGSNGKWAVRVGPSYPDIIWSFFEAHPRNGLPPKEFPVIELAGDNPMSVELNTSFVDPGATAEDAEDGAIAVTADCSSVDTSIEGTYSCEYTATDSDTNETTAVRQVVVIDPTSPTETCDQLTASPSAHITAGRAYAGGNYGLRALASGDDSDIGGSFDSWSSVLLYEGDTGQWFASEPAACKGEQGGEPVTCKDWNASILSHSVAGRAYYGGGYYTTGGDDYLGAIPGTQAWVKETSEGVFEKGQCE